MIHGSPACGPGGVSLDARERASRQKKAPYHNFSREGKRCSCAAQRFGVRSVSVLPAKHSDFFILPPARARTFSCGSAALCLCGEMPSDRIRSSKVNTVENDPQRVRESVDAVYRAESRRIFATLIRLLGDFELAEDALHDAFR